MSNIGLGLWILNSFIKDACPICASLAASAVGLRVEFSPCIRCGGKDYRCIYASMDKPKIVIAGAIYDASYLIIYCDKCKLSTIARGRMEYKCSRCTYCFDLIVSRANCK